MAYTNVDMPKDVDGKSIQTLSPIEATTVQIAIGAANARAPIPQGANVVELACSDTCRIKFGDASVDATTGTVARIFPMGVVVYRVPDTATHLAVVQFGSSTGFLTMVEMR